MAGGSLAPVIAGLFVGVAFIILLSISLHPSIIMTAKTGYHIVDISSLPSYEQQAIAKAKASKVAQMFFAKNPFYHVSNVDNDTINVYDDKGNIIKSEAVTTIRFASETTKAIFDTQAPMQTAQIGTALDVPIDMNGNVRDVKLFCFYSVANGNARTGAASAVLGESDVVKVLNGRHPC
jgi:hypothetical protein